MIKKLTNIGNSLGIVIEKPILELLGITKETSLSISTDGSRLIIEPLDQDDHTARVRNSIRKVSAEHEETLRKLAQ